MTICKECGAEISENDKFCQYCGAKLNFHDTANPNETKPAIEPRSTAGNETNDTNIGANVRADNADGANVRADNADGANVRQNAERKYNYQSKTSDSDNYSANDSSQKNRSSDKNKSTGSKFDYHTDSDSSQNDGEKFGLGLLSFFVPVAGIILYFVWNKERHETAKSCLTGALVSIGLCFLFSLIFIFIMIGAIAWV